MTERGGTDRAALFATISVALAGAAALVLVVAILSGSLRSDSPPASAGADPGTPVDLDDGAIADPDVDPDELMPRSAAAMADVRSVEFRLSRDGRPDLHRPVRADRTRFPPRPVHGADEGAGRTHR